MPLPQADPDGHPGCGPDGSGRGSALGECARADGVNLDGPGAQGAAPALALALPHASERSGVDGSPGSAARFCAPRSGLTTTAQLPRALLWPAGRRFRSADVAGAGGQSQPGGAGQTNEAPVPRSDRWCRAKRLGTASRIRTGDQRYQKRFRFIARPLGGNEKTGPRRSGAPGSAHAAAVQQAY